MKRRWVIADIHGHSLTLKTLVSDLIKPEPQDELYFLGDYIDRGPDSRGVIDFIRYLEDGVCRVIPLKGNHEDMMVEIYDSAVKNRHGGLNASCRYDYSSWVAMGARNTLESFQVDSITDVPSSYIDWMRKLSNHTISGDVIMMHAGLNFRIEDPFADRQAMSWIREFEVIPERIGRRRLIHGHVPVCLDRIKNNVRNPDCLSIDLDNGIYLHGREGYGNLVALELNSMELAVQRNLYD
ncbi:MAG: serine/threonine protein phosphatase [Alphaproteobacteria bacterium]|nr:serine/threonine protein phosphatase [Alphaproteobacteria bacterium]